MNVCILSSKYDMDSFVMIFRICCVLDGAGWHAGVLLAAPRVKPGGVQERVTKFKNLNEKEKKI